MTTNITFQPNKNEAVKLQQKLKSLGIVLDIASGHLFYHPSFEPLLLDYELVFIRHGETYGNCGQTTESGVIDHDLVTKGIKNSAHRIYQGDVDTEINQLTTLGKQQAKDVAEQLALNLLAKNWEPSIILYSPLSRAKDTGLPFVKQHQLEDRYFPCDAIKEINYGAWDNRRICDLEAENPCHLFYLSNHALVKSSGINATGTFQTGECFAETVLRAYYVLTTLEKFHRRQKILMFSHSMFGAACKILFGQGQQVEEGDYLAFDGKRRDGTSYTIPHTTPVFLT